MIDHQFIKELEGFTTKGHVPHAHGSKSGVTVGIGVDLAHTDINKLNLPKELYNKLVKYKGKKAGRAVRFLHKHPLHLTEEEATLLSQLSMLRYATFIKNYWNADSEVKWGAVPDFIQTIVYSVLYQYGRPDRVPKFWRYATTLDMKRMIAELRNFGDAYPTRRNKEADYLEGKLNEKGIRYA